MATTTKHGIEGSIQIGGESFGVLSMTITERLDQVPSMVVRATRDDMLPRPVTLLGSEATGRVGATELFEEPRTFTGLVTSAHRRIDVGGRPFLELTIEPPLFKLGKRTNVRSFLDKKAEDILQAVFDGAGVPVKFQLGETYAKRPNTIQYRETDLEFVQRLCSEEGIAMAWDHKNATAILYDDGHGLTDADDKTLPFIPEFGFDQPFACIQKVTRVQQVVPDKVHLREYDFERPRALVEAKSESKDTGAHALEVYEMARTVDAGAAKRLAQVLLDALQCRRDVYRGISSSWTLRPGDKFTLEGHPQEAMNQELLITGILLEHFDMRTATGKSKMETRIDFEAIPTGRSAYRPERRPRAAVLPGLQIATTSGASGQEVDVDNHARVTALFAWDRVNPNDDKASVRMRTMQLPTGGSMLLPRVGWEVLAQSQEGDPDTPFITGRLYNGIKQPPYKLPEGAVRSSIQTATTPGGGTSNELRTDDSKGNEEMFFNASYNMTTTVGNNTTENVGNNSTLKIGGNQELEITNSSTMTIGANQTVDVSGNQKVSIETFQVEQAGADYSYAVGGNRDMKVGGDHRHTIAANETIEVGAIKTDLVVGKVSETVDGNFDLKVGAADVTLTPADIALETGGNYDEIIGAAKVIISFGGIASDTTGTSMKQMIAAKADLVDGDRAESAGATFTSLAAGAQIVKADNIVFEAETAITLVMGASILSITPATVAFLGASAKLDGATAETAALVVDN